VHVPVGSDYYDRIVELSDSLGEGIEVVEVENAEQIEPLIEAVAEGRIRLTVSPANLAELSKARFSNIVAQPALGEPEPVAWAVRVNDPTILRELDAWLELPETRRLRDQLYTKYFVDRRGYQRRVEDELFASETGQISRFDSLLAREAKGIGWDWRLLAAQVAQESRFDPRARSWAGARGLLQLMPRTAREVGVGNPADPAQNVAGGVRYLAQLSEQWKDEIPDEAERLKFVLASYNAGRGHVLDAQRLAEKHGDNPRRWDDVAYWLLQKSKPSVYRDRVVRHGYVRGMEPVQYVSRILERYDRYRSIGRQ
jgi:membrane-bound lytic murein transglycosylase F